MKILVTGAGGFLGGAVARRLQAAGHTVCNLSRKRYDGLERLGIEQFQGDLADAAIVRQATKGCQAVVHVAAKAGIWGKYEDFYRANVLGTAHVIEACRAHRIGRLVYTSSPSVIFDGSDMEGVDESVPYPDHYKAAYPETKARAEKMVLSANDGDLATVALRPHLIWGPGDNLLIPGIIARARSGGLRRIGREDKRVDFTFIDDAAESHLLALELLAPGSVLSGRAYFITQGSPVYLWEFINRVLEAAELPPVRKSVSPQVAYALGGILEFLYRWLPLGGEPRMTRFLAEELSTAHWFDISAARRDLGYCPATSMAEGIDRLAVRLRLGS